MPTALSTVFAQAQSRCSRCYGHYGPAAVAGRLGCTIPVDDARYRSETLIIVGLSAFLMSPSRSNGFAREVPFLTLCLALFAESDGQSTWNLYSSSATRPTSGTSGKRSGALRRASRWLRRDL